MPSVHSSRAPRFSADEDELIADFLQEYEDLADSLRLTEPQMVETVVRYVPRVLQALWKTLPQYHAKDWDLLKAHLLELYPDVAALSRHTKQGLQEFLDESAEYRVCNEADVMAYYRDFCLAAGPLLHNGKITLDDYNTAFFVGFHPSIRDVLAERYNQVNPHHPVHEPFPTKDILKAACRHFTSNHFHRTKAQKEKKRDKQRGHHKHHRDGPSAFIQRTYGDKRSRKKHCSRKKDVLESESDPSNTDSDSESSESTDSSTPEFETKKVRFKQSRRSRGKDGKDDCDPIALVTKLQSLSVHEPAYVVLYSHCQKRFPDVAKNLDKPQLAPAPPPSAPASYQSTSVAIPQIPRAPPLASVSYQSTPPAAPMLPLQQFQPPAPLHTSVQASSSASATPKTDFFRARPQGCAFCGHLGHRIHACPGAEEYVDTGRVRIINRRLYLPTGEPIPYDGCGLGLKASVDTWLAANQQFSSSSTSTAPQRDRPPHQASFSFEVIPEPSAPKGAYITEADSDDDANVDN